MTYCRLWTSACAGEIFSNPEYDKCEILKWWGKNGISPDVFEAGGDEILLKFDELPDNRDTLDIIFVSIMERICDEDAVIRFEYRSENADDMEAIFIGKRLYLRVPYILDGRAIPRKLFANNEFRKVFWKLET